MGLVIPPVLAKKEKAVKSFFDKLWNEPLPTYLLNLSSDSIYIFTL